MLDLFEPLLLGGLQTQAAGTHLVQLGFDGFLKKTVTKTASFDARLIPGATKSVSFDASLSIVGATKTVSFDALVGTAEPGTLSITTSFDAELEARTLTKNVSFDGFLFRWSGEEVSTSGTWGSSPAVSGQIWIASTGVLSGFHDETESETAGSESPGGSGGTGGEGGSGSGGSDPDEPGPDAFTRFTRTVGFDCILFATDRVTVDLSAVLANPAKASVTVDALLEPSPAFSGAFSSAFDGSS